MLHAVPLSLDVGKARHDDAAALAGVGKPITLETLAAKGGQATLF